MMFTDDWDSIDWEDLKKVLSFPPYLGEFLHPVVYACTAVMLLCLFASIITYIVHHSSIRISRKGWHMLLNFCFHTALTFAVFAGGINRIKYPIICQSVGIVLHYSSLSTMLWLGVTARNIYKQVTKRPQQPQDGDHTSAHPAKSPMLRFYLVSGGVPFIICGITAAINIDNYGSGEQTPVCWMAWEPSLGAFYGPVSFILLVTCIYFLCAFMQLRKHPERRYELQSLREETQRLADTNTHPAGSEAADSRQCHGGCPGLINPSTLANEHSFKAQLRTAAFTLFLFISTWTFGALAVSQAHFLDMIFSCLYGAFSVTLGLFVLIHHCAKRDDVWHCWCACCPGRRAKPHHARIKKINANGDTHTHMHADAPKSILSHSHCACRCAQTPVSPCCGAIHTQQILEDDEAPHVLLHADPQGYRMHRCIKPPIRTKTRRRERELSFHIPESVHGSPHTHICHHICHHEALALCHHHVCCADEDLSCVPDANEVCVCGKPVQEDLHHVELQARRQSVPSQNGILKASAMYASDSTGNIRTGPWRNETTV